MLAQHWFNNFINCSTCPGQADTGWICWLSTWPKSYARVWVDPLLPNLHLKLLLPLPLVSFPPFLSYHLFSPFDYTCSSSCFFISLFFHTSSYHTGSPPSLPHFLFLNFTFIRPYPDPIHPILCIGLTSEGDAQGESEVLDWLEEVDEAGSDWLNSFFTFLYGLINPLEPLEEEEHVSSGHMDVQEEDEEDEEEGGVRRRGAKEDGNKGQKIVIVGLHNQ